MSYAGHIDRAKAYAEAGNRLVYHDYADAARLLRTAADELEKGMAELAKKEEKK